MRCAGAQAASSADLRRLSRSARTPPAELAARASVSARRVEYAKAARRIQTGTGQNGIRALPARAFQRIGGMSSAMRAARLEHFSVIFPVSLLRFRHSGSLRGRIHRAARDGTCSARIDPHTVFALAPVVNRLKNALVHEPVPYLIDTAPPAHP